MDIRKVGVVGCGLMGSGIVQVTAQAGFDTVVIEANDALLQRGLGRLRQTLDGLVEKTKLDAKTRDAILGRITGGVGLETLKACDLVVEAMTENQALKNETFATLDRMCPPHAILATNTSSCNVTALAAATKRPSQVVGLHFFNPVPLMKLVEVIRALTTSDETYQTVFDFAESLGKEPITAPDRPGFIVNRLLVPYLLDAIRAYENGLGTVEDIDKGMKLGCGYPMGPFTLLDFVGLDTTYYIANIMFEEFREPAYAPPPLLKRMVLAGRLGRKSGRGFYKYEV